MSDQKPFAEARDGRLIVGDVTVNYDFAEFWQRPIGRDRFDDIAAVVNAAVEQREAKLRGALGQLRQRMTNDGPCWCFLWPDEADDAEAVLARDGHGDACLRARAALEGAAPDYVPASELAAAKQWTEGAWVPLLDAMLESGAEDSGRVALALAAKLGIELKAAWADVVTDEQLEAEVKRRKALADITHVFAQYEYGTRDGRITIEGRSFCGRDLLYGGSWNAVTREQNVNNQSGADCADCIRAMRTAVAMVDLVDPV